MNGDILVFIEHNGKEITNLIPQLVTRGREQAEKLNLKLNAVILGYKIQEIVKTVSDMDFDFIFIADNSDLAVYNPELYTVALTKMFQDMAPRMVLFGDTYITREITPIISNNLKIPFLGCCVNLEISGTKLVVAQPKYGGVIYAKSEIEPIPPSVLVSLQSNPDLIKTMQKRTPSLVPINIDFSQHEMRTKVKEIVQGTSEGIDISKADILVSGGRGLGVKENITLIKELAQLLGGCISCSRPLTDMGWLPQECLVGMSGKTVNPNVYLACGISGAPQHLMAMSGAKCIIAINKDTNAPIFRVAHYAVVADVRELLPALIEEAKKVKIESKN